MDHVRFQQTIGKKKMLLFPLSFKTVGLVTGRVAQFRFVPENKILFHMESKYKTAYEEAVYALNGLQSNYATIQKARQERSKNAHLHLTHTKQHLKTLGIELQDLDNLNVIHVAGTKGKGSTCAFSESILRKHGYKTGFFSSPHLISVNERIRINGLPIEKELFAKYFWEVYSNIQNNLKDGECMPSYFFFLTVMAFYVFVREQVEAAVIEVGIGGLYDCTNIIRKPIAVGITTLGLDHVNILGNTIMEIAEQKAGIFKPFVPTFTVSQKESAMNVLRKKAQELQCPLFLSPLLEAYEENIKLSAQGIVQNINASLALQLTNTWLEHQNKKYRNFNVYDEKFGNEDSSIISPTMAPVFRISSQTQDALENCIWRGRFQTIEKEKITFYLDGAHTHDSMKNCVRWFITETELVKTKYREPVLKVLLFNCTNDRKAETLLDPLVDVHFDLVMFCPNRVNVIKDATSDLSNFTIDPGKEIQQCVTNKRIWDHLIESIYENKLSMTSVNFSHSSSAFSIKTPKDENSFLFDSISNAMNFVSLPGNSMNESCNSITEIIKRAKHIQMLVTGSLHLVGDVLSLIDS